MRPFEWLCWALAGMAPVVAGDRPAVLLLGFYDVWVWSPPTPAADPPGDGGCDAF